MISLILAAVLSGPIQVESRSRCMMTATSCNRLRQLLSEVEYLGEWDPIPIVRPTPSETYETNTWGPL